jgi:hypothetical protein
MKRHSVRHGLMARAATTALALTALTAPAQADAIDGQWCDSKGRSFKIDGPTIVTPGGTTMTGDYDRHGFTYIAPAAEPDAGQTVVMQLFGDDDLSLTKGPAGSARSQPEQWRRCNVTS